MIASALINCKILVVSSTCMYINFYESCTFLEVQNNNILSFKTKSFQNATLNTDNRKEVVSYTV